MKLESDSHCVPILALLLFSCSTLGVLFNPLNTSFLVYLIIPKFVKNLRYFIGFPTLLMTSQGLAADWVLLSLYSFPKSSSTDSPQRFMFLDGALKWPVGSEEFSFMELAGAFSQKVLRKGSHASYWF